MTKAQNWDWTLALLIVGGVIGYTQWKANNTAKALASQWYQTGTSAPYYIVDKNGVKMTPTGFTTLKQAVETALQYPGSKVTDRNFNVIME